MPVTGVTECRHPQEGHWKLDDLPGPESELQLIASCARAACARKAVTMASTRLQGRSPSEPGFEIQREVPLFSSQLDTFWNRRPLGLS